MRRRVNVSSKCECNASFTMYRDGNVVFKNGHVERCLIDPKLEDDDYVFRSGLCPSKKASIISTVSDLLSDYSTTNAVARRQIENSLLKSGDTGFGAGKLFCLWLLLFSIFFTEYHFFYQVNLAPHQLRFQKALSINYQLD